MAKHKGYRIVDCDQGFNVKTIQTSCDVDLEIGSTIGGTGNDRIFLGTTEKFVGDYYSGLTDNDDVLLTYVYDDADVLQGDPTSRDSEIVVSKACFLDASFFDLETQIERGLELREKVKSPALSSPYSLSVDVYHKARSGDSELVAIITVEKKGEDSTSTMNVLEMAYKVTQNLEGSWSKGETLKENGKFIENKDYNPHVEVIKPLKTIDGRVLGHRSSMVGDVFKLRGNFFEVDDVGWKKLDPSKVSDFDFGLM